MSWCYSISDFRLAWLIAVVAVKIHSAMLLTPKQVCKSCSMYKWEDLLAAKVKISLHNAENV